MNCKNATELLSDYVSGQMDRALTVSLENHLATCDNCRKEADGLRWAWSLLDQTPVVDTPPFFHENLMSRIAAETEQAEAEAARKRALWDWKAWFRPRTMAYATACAVMLLATMGGLHAVHASFDPIGPILRLFVRPASPTLELQTNYYDWAPNAQGQGTLDIHLQAKPKADGSLNTLHYHLELPGTMHGNPADTDANVTSDKETVVHIPLAAPPAGEAVSIKVSAPENAAEEKTLRVDSMLPTSDPSAASKTPAR